MDKKSKGFTLVELIVVLVILAILAAILLPALLGYIDRSKESQDMLKAKNMLTAAQTVLADCYAREEHPRDPNKDEYLVNSDFSKSVRQIADDDPYLTIIGVGDKRDADISTKDRYTVYFVAYWESKDKDPIFFNGTKWSKSYPWPDPDLKQSGQKYNYFDVNGARKCITFIFVADKTAKDDPSKKPWSYLQKTLKTRGTEFAEKNSTTKTGK